MGWCTFVALLLVFGSGEYNALSIALDKQLRFRSDFIV